LSKESKTTLLYISIAFLFSFLVRFIWFFQFNGVEDLKFNDTLMLTTNDAYYWAEGARDFLNGFHQENDLSPIYHAPSIIIAIFAKILPISLEATFLFLPAFLSSLIVVPIILIAKNLKNLEMGFIAALLASIGVSYYNRTMLGYLDTDMLNILFPLLLLWSVIYAIRTNENRYLLILAIEIIAYRWWYPQSYSLEFSFFALIVFYTLVFDRKNIYNFKLLSIVLLAMMGAHEIVRVIIVSGLYYVFTKERYNRYIYKIFALSIVAFLVFGGLNPIIAQLKGYVFRDELLKSDEGMGLHFFSVMQTVKEAKQIPFDIFATRISGHPVTFSFAFLGYLYLLYRHRIMLFSLPIVGLGFLAYSGGLRFTMYAVPILAFGMAFLISEFSKLLPRLRVFALISLSALALYPNLEHIYNYRVPTVFNKNEVDILDKLKSIADREDYVIGWWDYGYPLRYYSDVKTLVDGGKHSGAVNYPVSYILTKPQELSAKMARLDVEQTERAFKLREEDDNITLFSNIEELTKEYGFSDTNDFLASLADIKLPQKTRDIYFYLPHRMLEIYPTVEKFSNIDLMSAEMSKPSLFYLAPSFKQLEDNTIELGHGVSFKNDTIDLQGKNYPLRRIVQVGYDKELKFLKHIDELDSTSSISIIYLSSYNSFLVLDESVYNSLYVKLLLLDEYDRDLFEEVISTPQAKVFKLCQKIE
jgi:dolichyl-diphosphooligosaccharide--protein glycosyltransferase/undecaprenyl-diphosphooligosaccharide--protein glycosyltransferase